MKKFKKAAIRLMAVCIAIALCNIPCVALAAEAVSVTAVTVVGTDYTLPAKVNDKAVEWTATAVNTSAAGNHYYTGTDEDGTAVNLTLKVMETETIFSDDMQSYATGANATPPALVNGKGLSLDAYDATENNVYVDSVDETKAVKVLPKSKWSSKFVIGEEAYAGNFEVNMKIRAAFGTGVDTEILRTRVSAGTANNSNLVGGFLIKERADRIYAVAYDGIEENLKVAGAESSVVVTKGADKDSIGLIEVKMVFDSSNKTYDLYIEDELLISGFKMNASAAETTAVQSIFFAQRISARTDMTTYIEEISVNKLVDAQAYKTLIYEDMEKFTAATAETASTVTRPALIKANAEAESATAGLTLGTYENNKKVYIAGDNVNKYSYISGKSEWLSKLVLPSLYTGPFTVSARVKVCMDKTDSNQTALQIVAGTDKDQLAKTTSVGGIALRYFTSDNKVKLRATTQGGLYGADAVTSSDLDFIDATTETNWITVKMDFTGDGTYDIYVNNDLMLPNQICYDNETTAATSGSTKIAAIYFASRATDATCRAMIDDIKVTVPNTPATGKQLLIAGDSIAAGYDLNADTRGWGQVIVDRLQNITVKNNAVAGQYTRGFFDGNSPLKRNFFDELMWEANPGDILVLSFGHNERSRVTNNEYTIEDYKNYLGKFINKAKAYGVTTVLATSIAEAYFDGGNVSESRDKYSVQINGFATAMKEFAAANNIPVIDLYAKTKNLLSTIGEDSADNYYVADKTHLLERGAKTVARYLTEGFAATPLAPYVRTDLVDGGVVMTASVADGITSITIVNNNDVNYPLAKLIKAEYADLVLDTAVIKNAALKAGGTYNTSVSVTDGNTAKVFLFESMENLVPLTTSKDVE